MNAKVIVPFWDMKDPEHKTYYAGDTFEGTPERIAELAEKGHVEPIKASRQSKAKASADPETAEIAEKPAPKRAPRRSK